MCFMFVFCVFYTFMLYVRVKLYQLGSNLLTRLQQLFRAKMFFCVWNCVWSLWDFMKTVCYWQTFSLGFVLFLICVSFIQLQLCVDVRVGSDCVLCFRHWFFGCCALLTHVRWAQGWILTCCSDAVKAQGSEWNVITLTPYKVLTQIQSWEVALH